MMPKTLHARFAGLALLAGLALGATPTVHAQHAHGPAKAGDLRVTLNGLLAEHIYLATSATGAALDGRASEFQAAAAALDANSAALGRAIGSVYGTDAETAFLGLWRRHIGMAVDYVTGLAAKDKVKQEKAVNDLVGYSRDFAAFLSSANPNLPIDVVAGLVKTHVVTLKAVIDAQAAGDLAGAYLKTREAAAHMAMIADPLAAAIAKQFPEKYAMSR